MPIQQFPIEDSALGLPQKTALQPPLLRPLNRQGHPLRGPKLFFHKLLNRMEIRWMKNKQFQKQINNPNLPFVLKEWALPCNAPSSYPTRPRYLAQVSIGPSGPPSAGRARPTFSGVAKSHSPGSLLPHFLRPTSSLRPRPAPVRTRASEHVAAAEPSSNGGGWRPSCRLPVFRGGPLRLLPA